MKDKTQDKQSQAKPAGKFTPSKELALVVGSEALSRTEALKRVWDYIKDNKLQDAKDRRSINADSKLKPVFGAASISMFHVTKVLCRHLSR
jgi:chromatin remodeling complex protein RSC6